VPAATAIFCSYFWFTLHRCVPDKPGDDSYRSETSRHECFADEIAIDFPS